MKKKIVGILLSISVVVVLSACGGTNNVESKGETVATEKREKDLPDGEYSDMGNGIMYIATAGGTSENGNIPVIFVSNEILLQIGLNTVDFDGSSLSYIYIDGILRTKEQLATSQTTIDLSEDTLSVGKHKIEVVQYDSGEPDGNMITYKSAEYEIKTK